MPGGRRDDQPGRVLQNLANFAARGVHAPVRIPAPGLGRQTPCVFPQPWVWLTITIGPSSQACIFYLLIIVAAIHVNLMEQNNC